MSMTQTKRNDGKAARTSRLGLPKSGLPKSSRTSPSKSSVDESPAYDAARVSARLRATMASPLLAALALASDGPDKPLYGGSVPDQVVAHRRARNKAARRSRRINRGRA